MGRLTGVIRNQLSDPCIPHIRHIRVLGPQIRQGNDIISQPALLHTRLVVVIDRARLVEVGLLIKRVELAVVDVLLGCRGAHVIRHDVDH